MRLYTNTELQMHSFDPENCPKDSPCWMGFESQRTDAERKRSKDPRYYNIAGKKYSGIE